MFTKLSDESVESPAQDNNRLITPGKGASHEQMTDFQQIMSRYFDVNEEKWMSIPLSDEDRTRLYVIYVQMDEKQRNEQWIWFVAPLTNKSARKSITQNEWKQWNSPNEGNEIWLDGKNVKYSALLSYFRNDFSYFISRYTDNSKRKFRIDLWTEKGFVGYIQQNSQQISE